MINTLLVAASLKSMEEILKDNDIPYEIDEEAAYRPHGIVLTRRIRISS